MRGTPEYDVGRFDHDDQMVDFYLRANSLLPEGGTVVDLGAGDGAAFGYTGNDLIRKLISFGARNAKVIAVDVDEAVLGHQFADQQILWEPGRPIPVESESVDLVCSHWVLEHVVDTDEFASEVFRLLRHRGWFAARTVNADSYVGWNRFIRNQNVREFLLRRVGDLPTNSLEGKFPVCYKLNRENAVRRAFDERRFETYVFKRRSAQRYGNRGGKIPYLLIRLLNRMPFISRTDLIIFAQKR